MTTNTNAAPDNCTVLPDGSAFATASCPLPKNHWLYAPREYEPGAEEPKELPHPILTHAHRAEVVAAVRYAIRSATMCGKEKDFDPDALVQNAVYALCGPYGKAALSTAAQSQEELREDASYESMNLAVMVLSDCGHSSNYTPLLERVAGRIDRHVERLLTAQRADLTRRAQAEPVQPPAGIWVPTELAERVQETMGEFLMDHGWRQQDMDTSDEFGALLAVATKAVAAPAAVAGPSDRIPIEDSIAWQETGTGVERNAVMVSGRTWYRDDHPLLAPQARQIHDTARAAIDAARAAKEGQNNG